MRFCSCIDLFAQFSMRVCMRSVFVSKLTTCKRMLFAKNRKLYENITPDFVPFSWLKLDETIMTERFDRKREMQFRSVWKLGFSRNIYCHFGLSFIVLIRLLCLCLRVIEANTRETSPKHKIQFIVSKKKQWLSDFNGQQQILTKCWRKCWVDLPQIGTTKRKQ